MADERCFGSYVHGIFDNAAVIDFILNPFLKNKKSGSGKLDPAAFRQRQYDLLADWLREYIDIPLIYKILSDND